jgi:protein-glutamine gamma-glutamyltransferase
MKTPPFLLAATLIFWGWQSGFLLVGILLGVVLESARILRARWEMADADIIRIWNFSSLLGLAAAIFAFTSNEGPANFGKMLEHPDLQNSELAGTSSTTAAIGLIRWLPMIFYFFMLAQAYSSRAEFPLDSLSPFLRYRRRRQLKSRRPAPRVLNFNVSWPYFVLCLYAASAHPAKDQTFFWGLCGLLAWALWSQRPSGIARLLWVGTLAAVIVASLFGQRGLGQLARLTDLADNYNAQWLARFMRHGTDPSQSRTAIGQIGELQMSSQIVLRVTPVQGAPVPTYLREATYRTYHSPVWYAGGTPDSFSGIPETPANSERWILQPAVASHSLVNISCYLSGFNPKDGNQFGVLPLPLDCDHLEHLPAFTLQNNLVGTTLAEGPGLVIYDAGFGSGRTMDSPPETNSAPGLSNDLAVPDREKPALDAVIAQLPLASLKDAQKCLAVSHYFAAHYQYSIWQMPPKDRPRSRATNETALANFLLHTHAGHCEFFATATVLMLREMGIPARYAVGYVVHEPAGHHYVVRSRDAHAWCLVWNAADRNWEILDTTPASWIETEGKRMSSWQFVSDTFSWLGFQFAKFRWGQSHLRPYLLITLVPALGYFLYQIVFHRRRHQPAAPARPDASVKWPGLDSEFYQLEQALVRRGFERWQGQSLSHWLALAGGDPAVAGLQEPLRHLLRLHYRHRFDPRGLTALEREDLRCQVRDCLKRLEFIQS